MISGSQRGAAAVLAMVLAMGAGASEVSGADIVRHCDDKYAGDDQRSRLIVILADRNGNVAQSEYLRLWKNEGGRHGIADKVMLFARLPLDTRGVNFMRWGYTARAGRVAEQWVYLPEMHRVRRVSQRDATDVAWGYTDEDLRSRDPDEDDHRLVEIANEGGEHYYVVESVPRGESPYGKRITRYLKTDDWQDCAPRQVDYYDAQGVLFKQQFISWRVIGGAWVWDTAVMYNLREEATATYQMLDTEVNVGLSERLFTERQLQHGYPEFPR